MGILSGFVGKVFGTVSPLTLRIVHESFEGRIQALWTVRKTTEKLGVPYKQFDYAPQCENGEGAYSQASLVVWVSSTTS